MPGFFSLEAAKQGLQVNETIEACVDEARESYTEQSPDVPLLHIGGERETLWHKLDHLLYLPILGLTRPRDLYYYQGVGLKALYGFTYKYLTLEHFLGQLSRLQVGYAMADSLAYRYSQAWYPGSSPLVFFTDWHSKPHWCKEASHAGHITMWGRTMPGTKQLMLNGINGHLLGGWNYTIDSHMNQVLVDLEDELSQKLERPILCNIFDSEGSGLETSQRYAEAQHSYLTILSRQYGHGLKDFDLLGEWEPVIDDPSREAVYARWTDPKKAANDPRQFVLLCPVDRQEPTRIYAGCLPPSLPAAMTPWLHRQRWADNELQIRNLVKGANLNANYGYTYQEVPHRTRLRQWDEAQAKVEVTQNKIVHRQIAIHHLRQQRQEQQQVYVQQREELVQKIVRQRHQLQERQIQGCATLRATQSLARLRRNLDQLDARSTKRQRRLNHDLYERQTQLACLNQELEQRQARRDAIDTETLCRERSLEKDQIMLNCQVLLASCHDWACSRFFAPAWQNLSLDRATQMIYRKSGTITHHPDRIDIVLDAYRYADQQRYMAQTCRRFNQARPRWRDGRLLVFSLHSPD